jgi:hypothetical protein
MVDRRTGFRAKSFAYRHGKPEILVWHSNGDKRRELDLQV